MKKVLSLILLIGIMSLVDCSGDRNVVGPEISKTDAFPFDTNASDAGIREAQK